MCEGLDEGGEAGEMPAGEERICLKQTAEGRDRKGDSERGRNPNLSNATCEFWVIRN